VEQVASLPEESRRLRNPEIYHVGISPELASLKADLIRHAPGHVEVDAELLRAHQSLAGHLEENSRI
jgi:hypothetical protein